MKILKRAPGRKPRPESAAAQESHPQHKRVWHRVLLISVSYFLVEVLAYLLLQPEDPSGLLFGLMWSGLLTALVLVLPRTLGRILYGISYYVILCWTIAQTGYYQVFGKLMWLSTIAYAGEGADYLEVLTSFAPLWWIGSLVLLALGALVIRVFPRRKKRLRTYIGSAVTALVCILALSFLPQLVFLRDREVWGAHSDYAMSSSYEAAYNTMFDAKRVYDIAGTYQLTFRDLWVHEIYPLTPAYLREQQLKALEVSDYFRERGDREWNYMTGALAGKNVVLVLMESMDDWMITEEDTPTLCRLMEEGINFKNFYTPGYGNVRTFNSEFCVNTGVFLPTNGDYAFDYVTNHYYESMAAQLEVLGYSREVFHYNSPDFYSRGVFEPAFGYHAYNSYEDYTENEGDLFNDSLLFDIPELRDLFFRDGRTFNFIITRSAHLSYTYNEVLSYYAMGKYPQYRGRFGHEEVDCARVKARLVDDMFARLLEELEARGQLENTVIVGFTDHYTYGFKDTDTLLEISGVEDPLLLEKTPCFIWSPGGPSAQVEKALNTSDLLPTVLNLLGVDSPYYYLGQDAFDHSYPGFAFFPDGSWISDGVACRPGEDGEPVILQNLKEKELTEEYIASMNEKVLDYVRINNLLLSTDYYKFIRILG